MLGLFVAENVDLRVLDATRRTRPGRLLLESRGRDFGPRGTRADALETSIARWRLVRRQPFMHKDSELEMQSRRLARPNRTCETFHGVRSRHAAVVAGEACSRGFRKTNCGGRWPSGAAKRLYRDARIRAVAAENPTGDTNLGSDVDRSPQIVSSQKCFMEILVRRRSAP